MHHWLFICSQNKWRSPTAEEVFSEYPLVETDSAGLNSGAEVMLSDEQITWASMIFVMEKSHRAKLNKNYGEHLKGKRVVVLNIPDEYQYMDDGLIERLKKECVRYL